MAENNETTKAVETATKVRGVPFKEGDDPRRNLDGRPVGSRDFSTDFDEVVDDIAKENGMTKSEVRKMLLKVAYKNAKEGNYSFWKDIHDRLYGQAVQKIKGDINYTGKTAFIIQNDDGQDEPNNQVEANAETTNSVQVPTGQGN